jgi:myo-inositol-1(or 4)-monophosphatase
LNNKSIICISKNDTKNMIMLNSRSETRRGLWEPFKSKFKMCKPIGSVAYKLGLTAAGKADVFASLRPKNEWDICAGNCIINESGGKLIDLNGNQRIYNSEKTLIEPGLIAGDIAVVDKVYLTLKE